MLTPRTTIAIFVISASPSLKSVTVNAGVSSLAAGSQHVTCPSSGSNASSGSSPGSDDVADMRTYGDSPSIILSVQSGRQC